MANPDTIIASIFYLMTRHAQAPDAGLERSISNHLQMLAEHPGCDSEVLKDAGRRLSMKWLQDFRLKELGTESVPVSYREGKPCRSH